MTGRLRVTWREEIRTTHEQVARNVDSTTEVFSHQLALLGSGSECGVLSNSIVLNPGTHNWPFEICIPGSSPESIEGPHKTSISYEIEAVILQTKLLPTKYTSTPVRIIRSFPRPESELALAGRAEGVWPGKAEYRISLPQRIIPLGSAIHANIRIQPCLQGMKIRGIQCRLMEIYELQVSTTTHEACKEVAQWQFDGYKNSINGYEPNSSVFSALLSLPKSLHKCTQDVSVRGVKVRHLLSMTIEVQNSENQRPKVNVTLPVILSIFPNTVIDCLGNVVGLNQHEVSNALTDVHDYTEVQPPLYGEHILDKFVR